MIRKSRACYKQYNDKRVVFSKKAYLCLRIEKLKQRQAIRRSSRITKAWYNRKFFYNTIDIQRPRNTDAASFSAPNFKQQEKSKRSFSFFVNFGNELGRTNQE